MMEHCLNYVLKNHAVAVVTEQGNTYYKIPDWFSIENDTVVMHHTEIPKDLEQTLLDHNLGRKKIEGFKSGTYVT